MLTTTDIWLFLVIAWAIVAFMSVIAHILKREDDEWAGEFIIMTSLVVLLYWFFFFVFNIFINNL